ncbi:MAG: TonB-dependent receptor, partial [Acidobacteriota bacterium]|nr:TonB-dependent receptor [Acidobacteriota bacterium]
MNYSSKLPGAKAAAALVIVMMAVIPLRAQIDRGAIVGTVRDSSGAVIPNASVTVTNRDTGVSVSTRTNSAGAYQVLALIPGTYSAAAGAAGFSKQTQSGIVVQVQSRLAVNFTLNVGAVRQEVVVTTPPELLQTETAAVGHVLNSRQIVDLPLNGRRYADLALLEPGVQKYYAAANPAPDRFSSNGNLELQNDFLLNGIDNNSNSENLQEFSVQVVQPPPDALQEFKVQTRTYSAEFGASAGAVVNATLKSGTNQFHGDLWEFVRNNIFDANTFFNNKNGVPVGRFTQNQYGGTIGGPIIKDKTFFFFDYQKLSDRQSETIDSTVPTPMMKQGNFTELPFNLTPSAVAGQSGCLSGNVISGAGCIDSVGSKLLAVFPDPNIPSAVAVEGTPGSWSGGNNYQFATTVPDDTWSLDGRLDQQINEKNHLFGSYSYYHVLREDPPWTSNPLAGNGNFATSYHIRDQQVALSLNTTLSNSLLNELRVGFNREYAHSDPVGVALGSSAASQFGLNGIPVGPNTAGLPPININGLVRLGTSPWRPQWQIAQSWELLESITKLSGKHSIVAGYQYLHKSDNFLDIESPQGQITANGIYTAGGSFGVPDFLLGDIDSISFTTPLVVHDYNVGHSFYAQDTWQAKRNLTLNYGLRYELFSPVLNHQNELTNFSPANGGSLVTAASGSWYQRSLIHPDYNNFAPRVGFAYHPLSRVVVRGGYGVFYQPTNRIGSEAMEALNPPWLLNANLGQ